jgi:CHAT domain-containing protein/tetratricopeptide (TPR) repeat protein
MKPTLIFLCLTALGYQHAQSQSFANILIFPLGETVDSLYRAGYFRKVLPYAESAFAVFGDRPVSDTAAYAKAMYRLGEIEYQSGYYDRAFPHLQGAFSLYYGLSGMNDDTCARMCCALSMALSRAIRWEEADSLLTRMIVEAEGNQGVSEFARLSLRWCQGTIYHNQRKYEQAQQIYESCQAGWEALGSIQTEEYCAGIYQLSGLASLADDVETSMRLDSIGLAISRQIYGNDHPVNALFLNGIAMNNMTLGNWGKSIAYYEESISILREKKGADSWILGIITFNLGNVYLEIGDYDHARRLYEQVLKIILNTHGKKHSDYPMLLSALGRVVLLQKDYDTAEILYQESLQARIEILGKGHPYYPAGLSDLASVYLDKNQPERAYPLLVEALAAQIAIDGPRHSSVAVTLQQIGLCRLLEGRYVEADSIMGLSGQLFHAIYGDHAQTVARHMDNRMLTRMCLDPNDEHIVPLASQGHNIWKNTAQRAMGYASPQQLESLLFSLSFHNNLVNAVGARGHAAGLAYDNALLFKNLALQSRADIFKQWNIQRDTTAMAGFKHWQQIQRRLGDELAKPQAQRRQVDSLENLLQQLERSFAAGAGLSDRIIPDWRAVRDALQPGEAAVEFVHYTPPRPLPDAGKTRYAALLLLPGDPSPRFIPLFEEERLVALLQGHAGDAHAAAALYVRSGHLLDERPQHGAELYNLIWKPIDRFLPRRVSTVYVSVSGLLHRINLTTLPVGKKQVIADRYAIRQTGSTRQVTQRKPDPIFANAAAVLYGGIRYHSDSTALSRELLAYQSTGQDRGIAGFAVAGNRDTTITWDYLPGTANEVTNINKLLRKAGFQTDLFTGWSAAEESIQAIGSGGRRSPGVLHIATHGYFYPAAAQSEAGALNTFAAHNHPLFRSGLLLAGAEYAWRTGRSYGDWEDGILTAYEISNLNLSNTKLAVLSACQTGLGDIKGSEGVYGLQRAFKMAGVDYLLVSLWQVPDRETAEFMEAFYSAWLGGKTIHQAFAKAQKKMRKKFREVYKWGAWVLVE